MTQEVSPVLFHALFKVHGHLPEVLRALVVSACLAPAVAWLRGHLQPDIVTLPRRPRIIVSVLPGFERRNGR